MQRIHLCDDGYSVSLRFTPSSFWIVAPEKMEFSQSIFVAAFMRLIARDRALIAAISYIDQHLELNSDRTFYLHHEPQYKSVIVKRLPNSRLRSVN